MGRWFESIRAHHKQMFRKSYLKKNLRSFINIYKQRPIKNNYSGMKIDHSYALFCLLKKIKPKYVIESGVWKGHTTWLIKKALKDVKIYSIDINLKNIDVFFKDVEYLNKDITKYNWNKLNKNKTLIIFDDHVCFSKRLNFIKKNKFKHLIFDDNLPNGFISYYTPKMIYENQILIVKKYIKFTNISRICHFLIDFLFNRNFYKHTKIFLNLSFLKIIYPKKINIKLNRKFSDFRKRILFYYEFPPITKFDLNKRFKKVIFNFNEKIDYKKYKVKKPITNLKNLKLDKDITNEFNEQYSNICYIKLKRFLN